MRIGLIADTHDRLPAIAELVRQMQAAGVGMILHAGDYCSPFALKAFEDAHMSLAGVFGRNDGDREGLVSRAQSAFGAELFESPHSFEIGGRRILLVHDIGDVNKRSVAVARDRDSRQHAPAGDEDARRHADRQSRRRRAAGSTARRRPRFSISIAATWSS